MSFFEKMPARWAQPVAVLAVAATCAALVLGLREAKWLERLELPVHDALMAREEQRLGAGIGAPSAGIAIVVETEADLQRLGHPLSDETLLKTMQAIEAQSPAMIVVDKYRDLPVAPGSEVFADYLSKRDNILWVAKHGANALDGVKPPQVLQGSDRVGCADVPVDHDGRARRYMLVMGEGDRLCPSLAYLAAARLLAGRGQSTGFDEKQPGQVQVGERRIALARANEGPYVDEDVRGFQVHLQLARPAAAPYTLGALLDGKIPADALRGKVVFVGSDAISLRDSFAVPARSFFSAGSIPGVTLHAMATAELLDAAAGAPRATMVPHAFTTGAVMVTTLAVALMMMSALSIPVAALLCALLVLVWAPATVLAAASGVVLAPVAPIAAGLMALLAGAGARAWQEARQRAELMGWFSKHVSREVAEAIWHQRDAFTADGRIPPRKVHVTVLFADIRGYTTISEQLSIPVMVDWINRSISQMVAAVMENQGVVTRFAGDQVMAVFGVPIPRIDESIVRADAINAVRAGLAMGERLTRHNVQLASEGLPAARVRVGIFSGEVVQAGLGSADRFEFTVLGDVVNTASRLESFSTDDDGTAARVLIGAPTRTLIGDSFELVSLGPQKLKGKDEPIEIFRVFANRSNAK